MASTDVSTAGTVSPDSPATEAEIIIRFITEADSISQAIRWETWSAFSHVEFVLPGDRTLGAHANGGVMIKPLTYCKPTNEERYRLVMPVNQQQAILAYATQQLGKPYDFTNIAGILAHRDWRVPNRWICSELVTACFEHGGLPLLNAPEAYVHRITPRDLYLSPMLIGNRVWPI